MILALECSNLNLNFALGLFIFPQKLEFAKKRNFNKISSELENGEEIWKQFSRRRWNLICPLSEKKSKYESVSSLNEVVLLDSSSFPSRYEVFNSFTIYLVHTWERARTQHEYSYCCFVLTSVLWIRFQNWNYHIARPWSRLSMGIITRRFEVLHILVVK